MPNCWHRGRPSLAGADYPAERLGEAWKLLCLNQFHDILPGSSIAEVYVDAAKDHAWIASITAQIIDDAVDALSSFWHADTRHVSINPTAFGGRRRATIPAPATSGATFVDARTGSELTQQAIDGGTLVEIEVDGFGVVEIGERQTAAPPQGARSTSPDAPGEAVGSGRVRASVADDGFVLENAVLRVELSEDGEITRLLDKEHRSGGRRAESSGQRVPSVRGPTNRVRRLEHRPVHQRPAVVSRIREAAPPLSRMGRCVRRSSFSAVSVRARSSSEFSCVAMIAASTS